MINPKRLVTEILLKKYILHVTKNFKKQNLPTKLLYNSASLEKFQKVADSMDRAGVFFVSSLF